MIAADPTMVIYALANLRHRRRGVRNCRDDSPWCWPLLGFHHIGVPKTPEAVVRVLQG